MSRRARAEKGGVVRADAVRVLLAAGDHRGAAAEARRTLADATAPPEAREAAREALASLGPEPSAVAVGLGGVALAVGIVLWTVLVR